MKHNIAPLLCLSLFPAGVFAKDIVIHAGRLIDGIGNAPRTQVSILIKDDRITGVQAGFVTLPGAGMRTSSPPPAIQPSTSPSWSMFNS